MQQIYPNDDAQQILRLALAKQDLDGELTRSQLLEIAAELGVNESTLRAAEAEWLTLQNIAAEQAAFNNYRRQRFQHHLVRYSIVNGILLLLDWQLGGIGFFSLTIASLWGIGLALHGWNTYQDQGYRYENAFENWRRRRQLKRSVSRLMDRVLGA